MFLPSKSWVFETFRICIKRSPQNHVKFYTLFWRPIISIKDYNFFSRCLWHFIWNHEVMIRNIYVEQLIWYFSKQLAPEMTTYKTEKHCEKGQKDIFFVSKCLFLSARQLRFFFCLLCPRNISMNIGNLIFLWLLIYCPKP